MAARRSGPGRRVQPGGGRRPGRARLGDTHDEVEASALGRQLLHLRFNRANILRSLGRFDEARDLDEAVLAEQRRLLGAMHPHSLMTAGSLGG